MKRQLALAISLILLSAPALAEVELCPPGQLRVGLGRADITPPVGAIMTGPRLDRSVGTDDPLVATALVVQSGERTIAIVGIDLVKIRRDLADAAIAEASRRTGIDRDAVMICPSHNHSSPFIPMGGPNNAEYLATLPKLIADSIEQAHRALQPARMLLGRSLVFEGHHNRRVVSKADGMVLNTWLTKLGDLEQTPQVLGTEGPIDPELWVARFDALDGQVLGTLVNFTCHPSLHDRIRLKTLSADYPAVIAEHMADAYGEEVVTVFTQGAAGNINPSSQFVANWREKAAVFAAAAVHAARNAKPIEGPIAVGYARRDVVVPCCDPTNQRVGAVARLGWREDSFNKAKSQAAKGPKTREVPVNAARIGPLGIATNAGELFVEWGIEIKRRSPFPHTIVSELTNDWIGYEPTAQAFEHEGYESLAGVNFVSLEGIQILVDTAVELLDELWKEDGRSPASHSTTSKSLVHVDASSGRQHPLVCGAGGDFPDGRELAFENSESGDFVHAVFPAGVTPPEKLDGPLVLHGHYQGIQNWTRYTHKRPKEDYRYFVVSSWDRKR
jgi:hypothetical protein